MKAAIIFYSFTGNTRKAASAIKDFLVQQNIEVKFLELKPEVESKSSIKQAAQSLFARKVKLSGEDMPDLSGCDYIFLGTPVWALAPAPAIRSLIQDHEALKDKKVSLFVTYGSGLGKEKCLDKMENLLSKKANSVAARLMISDKKVDDNEYLLDILSRDIKL
ncbi:MAG: hypothetical protein P9X27_06125 [Candidatus Kaelpia aquatica]|nr:hypothetical protein [Candidatus Kaelpia aquatica]